MLLAYVMRCVFDLVAFGSRREEVKFALAPSVGTWCTGVLRLERVVRLAMGYLMSWGLNGVTVSTKLVRRFISLKVKK